jgi:GxxExxY protein
MSFLKRNLSVKRQQGIPVIYETIRLDLGFRADFIIDDKLIAEIKSIEIIAPVHQKQVLTYLRLTGLKLGLLVNFNCALIKDGIQRVVNNL